VAKRFEPTKDGIMIAYELENESEKELPFLFGIEWNFYLLPQEWEVRKDTLLLVGGKWRLEFSGGPTIWHFPLQTLSQSEEGYDIIQQGMCFLPHWEFSLAGRQKFDLTINLKEGHES
jgi:hypothetical protein